MLRISAEKSFLGLLDDGMLLGEFVDASGSCGALWFGAARAWLLREEG